jgi:cysteine-rich repeat protein
MSPLSPRFRWLLAALALSIAEPSRAQVEVVAPVTIPEELPTGWFRPSVTFDVVGGRNGGALVVWTEAEYSGNGPRHPRTIVTRTFDPAAATFGPIVRQAVQGSEPLVALSQSGGAFLSAWAIGPASTDRMLSGRALDASGAPASSVRALDDDPHESFGVLSLAADGSDLTHHTLAWGTRGFGVSARRIARDGSAGLQVEVEPTGVHRTVGVANTIDGGFVVGYGGPVKARGFTVTGVPKSDAFGFTDGSQDRVQSLAASPVADEVAMLVLDYDASGSPYPLSLHLFTSSGTVLAPPVPITTFSNEFGGAEVRYDRNGNLYVAWAGSGTPLHIQAFHADGTAAGPVYDTPAVTGALFASARLSNGDFVNVWRLGETIAYDVVSLCTPGSSTCGDGTLDTFCETCDAGAGNSDTTPDACRSNCELAHCGDGTVDGGESCDDGNVNDCDGCSADCVTETGLGCGDGIPFPACGEACDDGNAIDGDGCTTCVLERGPGGGSAKTECFSEWSIDNPANEPRFGKTGGISDTQACTDDDPRCDFDGGVPGSCTFHVRVCANNSELTACTPATRLASWEVRTPSVNRAATRPAAAAVRDAFLSVVPGSIVGTSQTDVCSPFADIPVLLRGSPGAYAKGRVTVKTSATLYDGRTDADKLRLECRP